MHVRALIVAAAVAASTLAQAGTALAVPPGASGQSDRAAALSRSGSARERSTAATRSRPAREVTRPASATPGDKQMHPLLFSFLLNRASGQTNQEAARNTLIGHAVGTATAGIAHPVAQAVIANELTARATTGQPAGAASNRAAAVEVIVQNASH